jgi:hypothetical protein
MRVGAPIYACDSGLGVLAKSFVGSEVVNAPFVVEHAHHTTHRDWYPGAPSAPIRELETPRNRKLIEEWACSLDVLVTFETPFCHWLYDHCRRMGIPSVLMTMFECTFEKMKSVPDQFWCPSLLDMEYFSYWTRRESILPFEEGYVARVNGRASSQTTVFTPVPVDVPWRQRDRAETFVFNNGNGGLKGRNGAADVLAALDYVKSNAKFIIRSQGNTAKIVHPRIRYEGVVPYDQLWVEGDVLIFPERFNGLSLPLQEARAAGMVVMCGDRFPMNTWLPKEPLLPVKGYHRERVGPPYNEYDCAEFDPKAIAAKIDEWFGRDVLEYSRQGREWVASMSWVALKPGYMNLIEDLVEG